MHVVLPITLVGPSGRSLAVEYYAVVRIEAAVPAADAQHGVLDEIRGPRRRIRCRDGRASIAVDAHVVRVDVVRRPVQLGKRSQKRPVDPIHTCSRNWNLVDGAFCQHALLHVEMRISGRGHPQPRRCGQIGRRPEPNGHADAPNPADGAVLV